MKTLFSVLLLLCSFSSWAKDIHSETTSETRYIRVKATRNNKIRFDLCDTRTPQCRNIGKETGYTILELKEKQREFSKEKYLTGFLTYATSAIGTFTTFASGGLGAPLLLVPSYLLIKTGEDIQKEKILNDKFIQDATLVTDMPMDDVADLLESALR